MTVVPIQSCLCKHCSCNGCYLSPQNKLQLLFILQRKQQEAEVFLFGLFIFCLKGHLDTSGHIEELDLCNCLENHLSPELKKAIHINKYN